MKILFAQKIIGIAGSENYLLNIIPALKNKGIHVEFLCLYPVDEEGSYKQFNEILISKGIKVHLISYIEYPKLSVLRKINSVIKSNDFDVVHSHLIHTDLFLALTKLVLNRKLKLISTKHGYEEYYNNRFGFDPKYKQRNTYWWMAKIAERMMNHSFAISKGLQNLYIGLGICKSDKLDLIHYGFDFKPYNATGEFRESDQQLVIVGRLTDFKGHRYAFQAIALLKDAFPKLKLLIVGSGRLEDKLKSIVKKLAIQNQVIFVGYHSEGRAIMADSDIVLIPSVAEGFGVVVLEAFAVKKPIVAFDVPSIDEHIVHNESGLLTAPYDVKEYANAIKELLNNPSKRNELAEKANQKLISYYNSERMVSQTIALYKSVVNL